MIHISLFSGIGGFELAAEWMGWRNLVSCDINEFGNKVRKYYWPEGYCHTDIKTLTYETINNELSTRFGHGWRNDDIIITGGFPCQPYSTAGKRLGKDDQRHLWPEMLRVISEVKPTYIVGENVRGLTNWNGGVVFEELYADLENLGYKVQPVLLPACAVGAPHRRDRIWFVAYSNGNEFRANQHGGLRCENGKERAIFTYTKNIRREDALENGELERRRFRKSYQRDSWDSFPTQPPICGGDDGLPTRLDNITFPKWRNESIKAYGNAIVPQVVYQIFKSLHHLQSEKH